MLLHTRKLGDKHYELTDHLGNVGHVFTDRKLAGFDTGDNQGDYDTEMVSATDYYPFGMMMPGRSYESPEYRYGFNGMEKDDEVKGSGNSYDFGARIFDPRIGRWLATDPREREYPAFTPYGYALNTPIGAIDPDGEVVIFINGNHFGDGGKAEYWRVFDNGREIYAFDKEVMKQFNDQKAIYRDGALGGWAPLNGNLSAQNRRNQGYWKGESDAKALIDNLDEGETIKIVTHSMGAAYAKGYVAALITYMDENDITGVEIEIEVDFAPFQPDDKSNSAYGSQNPAESEMGAVPTFQASHSDDRVAGDDLMKGAEQVDTSDDSEQGHSIFDFNKTVKQLGGLLNQVRNREK